MKNMKAIVALLLVFTVLVVGCVVLFNNISVSNVEDFTVSKSTSSQQTLQWKKGKNVKSYELSWKDKIDADYKLLATVSADQEPIYIVKDLESAEPYSYRIVAINEFFGKTFRSEPVTVSAYTSPNHVEGFTVSTKSEKALTADWEDLQDLAGFELVYGKSKDLKEAQTIDFPIEQAVSNRENGTLSYTIENLEENVTYFLKMRCYLAKDGLKSYSEWSDTVQAKVTKAVDMSGIDVSKPMVALTFDDGPDYGDYTKRIAQAVEGAGGKATFFQVGDRASELPNTMKRLVQGGHEIGCHTYDHNHYGSDVTKNDIVKGDDAIEDACGVRPTVFRSTGGMTTDTIRNTCVEENMPIFFWSLDTRDWESRNADSIVDAIKNNVSDGDIILMHNIYESSAEAAEIIAPWLQSQGYQLVTVSQLVQAKTGAPPTPGVQYYTATHTD